MSNQSDSAPKSGTLLSLRGASSLVRSVFARERQEICENQFYQFIRVLEQREYQSTVAAQEAVENLYSEWAKNYQLLKDEFNSVWDLFHDVENRVSGWYCISPNLARWKTIASTKTGYSFAACLMKNHHRDAPLSEKSLSVSFGLDDQPPGIGDERMIGFQGAVSDTLAGLSGCSPRSLREQGDGMRALYRKLESKQLIFRLNHRSLGQQVTKLPISILQEYSLRELCQGLFLMLNNDIISELNTAMSSPKKLLAAVDSTRIQYIEPEYTEPEYTEPENIESVNEPEVEWTPTADTIEIDGTSIVTDTIVNE